MMMMSDHDLLVALLGCRQWMMHITSGWTQLAKKITTSRICHN